MCQQIGSNSYEFITLLLNTDERLQILIGDNFPMDPNVENIRFRNLFKCNLK